MRYLLFLLLLTSSTAFSQGLYLKTFGNEKDQAIIFLHGGPGGSTLDFELTTAQKLADDGFFVVAYDRRGEGRSENDSAKFTYDETFADLLSIYHKHKLDKASLIGHSFGGIVATLFAEKHPEKVKDIVLVASPVALQQSFRNILKITKPMIEAKNDSTAMAQYNFVTKQDTSSIYYSSGCFMLAMNNGLYTAENQSDKAKELQNLFMTSPEIKAYQDFLVKTNYKTMFKATMGFLNNENYTNVDIRNTLKSLKGIKLYGIYGKEDGLFGSEQLQTIKTSVLDFQLLDNCSHGVFIDQQEKFLNLVKQWLK